MRTPLLLSSLLALGVLPPLPKPRKQEDLDLEASERMMNALWAADINPADVVAFVGPARFVETGRAVLAVAKHHVEEFGTQPHLSELLGIVADLEAAHLRLREMTPREPLEEAQQAGFTMSKSAMAGKTALADILQAMDAHKGSGAMFDSVGKTRLMSSGEGPHFGGPRAGKTSMAVAFIKERSRALKQKVQREARKVRKAAKARRGW